MEFTKEVDATGLRCPLPILRCKKGLNELKANEILKVIATDTSAVKDFKAYCTQTGHELLALIDQDATFTFYIKKRAN